MLARLLGFMLGNRGGLAPKIDVLPKYGMHVYCSRALSSPPIEVAVVQFAQVHLVYIIMSSL